MHVLRERERGGGGSSEISSKINVMIISYSGDIPHTALTVEFSSISVANTNLENLGYTAKHTNNSLK